MSERKVWTCKIGGTGLALPQGADQPMRAAVWAAFDDLFGCAPEFVFSGWGGDLDESELAVVEDREPDPDVIREGLIDRLANMPGTVIPATGPGEPPDGCEWVALPVEVVTDFAADGVPGSVRAAHLINACRKAVARRPKPAPATERVPWWEAAGRRLPRGQRVVRVERTIPQLGRRGAITITAGSGWNLPVDTDGTVEVLVEDGDQ